MSKLCFLLFAISFILVSCSKQDQFQRRIPGKTWDARVVSTINSQTTEFTGTFTFSGKPTIDYTSELTDAQGNTFTDAGTIEVQDEAATLRMKSDTVMNSSGVVYFVNINERKEQEWSYNGDINGTIVENIIYLSRD